MRTWILSAFAACSLLATAARADDNKPPAISDVKAVAKGGQVHVEARITDETGVLSAVCHHRGTGGKVEDSPMVKNDYDDVFKVSFPGSGDTEYWIEASDLLGNGPSTYGSSSKAFSAGGKPGTGGGTQTATKDTTPAREPPPRREPPPDKEPTPEPRPRREPRESRTQRTTATAKTPEPPVIEHRKPSTQPPEGRDFTVRMKIKSDPPVAVAILQVRPQGATDFTANTPLTHTDGESYEGVIAGSLAKGTLEYFITAKNPSGQITRQGDGDSKAPYLITFKPPASSATASASAAPGDKPSGPYAFSHLPLYRVAPNKPIVVRAQIVPSSEKGDIPDRAAVLWRGNDAQDQLTEMVPDQSGGWGGFRADLPPQEEGAIFYQIVACDPGANCGADTGSKRKWHSAAVATQPGAAQPMSLDAVSSKAPASVPE